MDVPSSSNVTGRRKRIKSPEEEDDDEHPLIRATPSRSVRGNKRINPQDVAPSSIMSVVNNHVDEIINRKKVGSLNCFEFKSPLELFGIEQMIAANASIQEMAVVLDGAQQVIGYRVDRLHHDIRQLDAALSSGDVNRGTNSKEEVHLNVESRRAKKKMAVADGMSGISDFLNQMADIDPMQDADMNNSVIVNPQAPQQEEEEEEIAGEKGIDPKANSRDVDLFLEKNMPIEDAIKSLVINRASNLREKLNSDMSRFASGDDTAHDIKDSSIDWLRSNPNFQKATKGSLDNSSNSFHSLNFYGSHSPSGRTLNLHPRITDKNANDRYYQKDLTLSLAKNTHALLENSMGKKPHVLDNYLMLEVKDRPVIGRYKIMVKEAKKQILPLAEASREKDLANLTFAEVNQRTENPDITMAGSLDISMLPVNQGLPLTEGENDQTIGRMTPSLNQTVSVNQKSVNDEYVPPSYSQLGMDESLVGKLPYSSVDMTKLTKIFDEKISSSKSSDMIESKIWRNGMRAEEWGDDDATAMKNDTRFVISSGIDGWIKATDSWSNSEAVKMIVNRDARNNLEDSVVEDTESGRTWLPDIGKNVFLVKSDEYMNTYPTDRAQDMQIVGEELDVMKLLATAEEEKEAAAEQNKRNESLDDIRTQLREQQYQRENDVDMAEDVYDHDDRGFDIEFDNNLAAPVEVDDIAPVNNRSEADQVADILFDDQMDVTEEQVRDERVIQQEIENIALGSDEVAELMTAVPPVQLVGPTAEMREEVRNIGRVDNAHWVPPEIADQEKQAVVQRKRREKRGKGRKVTCDDFSMYFRAITEDEIERETASVKCKKVSNEKGCFLTEQSLYLTSLGIEAKPHVAFEMGILSNSGIFFKKPYGKIKLERIKQQKTEREVFVDEVKGNKEPDCLNWLTTFSGFRCMENPVPVDDVSEYDDHVAHDDAGDGYVPYVDDSFDPQYAQDRAAAQMGPEMQRKFALAKEQIRQIMPGFNDIDRKVEYEDSDDEFDDSFDRQTIQAKNLDAAKHKKCLAEILKSDTLSMPSIQYALEQLTLNQTLRQSNTSIRGPSVSRNEISASPTASFEADKTLTSVFEYHAPNRTLHNVTEIMKALTEVPDYLEEDEEGAVDKQAEEEEVSSSNTEPSSSKYGTANTENRKVQIRGCHTLLSLALSMPSKMGENVRPSSIVSFLLHIANENGLQIVQDRSKRSWMSDFIVLNQSEALPRGLKMGKIEDQDDFWKRTQDPDAIEGGETDQNSVFGNMKTPRPKAVPARKGGRGAAPRGKSPELEAIAEEDDMDL